MSRILYDFCKCSKGEKFTTAFFLNISNRPSSSVIQHNNTLQKLRKAGDVIYRRRDSDGGSDGCAKEQESSRCPLRIAEKARCAHTARARSKLYAFERGKNDNIIYRYTHV